METKPRNNEDRPTNEVLFSMMHAWNDTLGTPLTRYEAIYKVVAADIRAKDARYAELERLAGLAKPSESRNDALVQFAEWFRANYPGPDTIIHKPDWHAPKIFRAAEAALRDHALLSDAALQEARGK